VTKDISALKDMLISIQFKGISLRSNTDYLLILISNNQEKRVYIYPKIEPRWLIQDLLTAIGFCIDAYAGNWNYFEDIDASSSKYLYISLNI